MRKEQKNGQSTHCGGGDVLHHWNGFTCALVFEQPVEVSNRDVITDTYRVLFAEVLHKDRSVDVDVLQSGDAICEQGWRIYYQKKNSATDSSSGSNDAELYALVSSHHWFSLRSKGPDAVGVYFPAELSKNEESLTEFMQVVDAYFRSTEALVETPRVLNLRECHVNPHGVENPWSGVAECCVDLFLHAKGSARINGVSIDRNDPVYQKTV